MYIEINTLTKYRVVHIKLIVHKAVRILLIVLVLSLLQKFLEIGTVTIKLSFLFIILIRYLYESIQSIKNQITIMFLSLFCNEGTNYIVFVEC